MVIPLVFEHFGPWGNKQLIKYLNKLAKSARDDEGKRMRPTSRTSGDQLFQ